MSASALLDAPPSSPPTVAADAPLTAVPADEGPLVGPVPPGCTLPVHRVTVEQYERWIALGALGPEDKVELLDGYIIDKVDHLPAGFGLEGHPDAAAMSENLPHVHAIRELNEHFFSRAAERWVTQSQTAVLVHGRGLPEPDLALLRPPRKAYARRRPAPDDVLLLIEVSETSLATDRGDKLRAYARAGIPEYWIVNLPGRQVEVHRDPDPAAERFASVRLVTPGENFAPAAFPDAALSVAELFGGEEGAG